MKESECRAQNRGASETKHEKVGVPATGMDATLKGICDHVLCCAPSFV